MSKQRQIRKEIRKEKKGKKSALKPVRRGVQAFLNPAGAIRGIVEDLEVNRRMQDDQMAQDLMQVQQPYMPEVQEVQGGLNIDANALAGEIGQTPKGVLGSILDGLTGETANQRAMQEYEQSRREVEARNKEIEQRQGYLKQVDKLGQLASQAPTYSAQRPYLDAYYDLYSQEFPTSNQRLDMLSDYGGLAGQGGQMGTEANELLGYGGEEQLINDYYAGKFAQEFGQPTGDPELDQRNIENLLRMVNDPQLAQQYYNNYNPNLIESVGDAVRSYLPTNLLKGRGFNEEQDRSRLSGAGLQY
jgi:hypothetical protein